MTLSLLLRPTSHLSPLGELLGTVLFGRSGPTLAGDADRAKFFDLMDWAKTASFFHAPVNHDCRKKMTPGGFLPVMRDGDHNSSKNRAGKAAGGFQPKPQECTAHKTVTRVTPIAIRKIVSYVIPRAMLLIPGVTE